MVFSLTKLRKKTEENDTSLDAVPATLNAHVLSTVFEIPPWFFGCATSKMEALLYLFKSKQCNVTL
jgi:hypothetical protein